MDAIQKTASTLNLSFKDNSPANLLQRSKKNSFIATYIEQKNKPITVNNSIDLHQLNQIAITILKLSDIDLEHYILTEHKNSERIENALREMHSPKGNNNATSAAEPFSKDEKLYFSAERRILEARQKHYDLEPDLQLPRSFANLYNMSDADLTSLHNSLTPKEINKINNKRLAGGPRLIATLLDAVHKEEMRQRGIKPLQELLEEKHRLRYIKI